jgi:transcriptional regulator with XRE-family HTH domain
VATVNPNERARRIRQARDSASLTQEELAAKIPVEPREIRRWERGESAPGRRNLRRLAEVTGKEIDWLRGVVEPDFFSSLPRPTTEQELERIALDLDRLASREAVDPLLAALLRDFRDRLYQEARDRSREQS